MLKQQLEHHRAYLEYRLAERLAKPVHEVLHEDRDILLMLAKRRQVNGIDIQPVEKILAEFASLRHGVQVAIGRGQNANVDRNRARASDPVNFLLLERSQQLHLQMDIELGNFIQEDRPPVCKLELAQLRLCRPRERSFLMSEQLALYQFLDEGRTIHRDKHPLVSLAGSVNLTRHELLPRP